MNDELIFRCAYGLLFLLTILPRMSGMMKPQSDGRRHDSSWLNRFGMLCMLLFFTSTVQYVFLPDTLAGSYLNLPHSLRYSGFASSVLGITMLLGAERQLGRQFSNHLEIRDDHQLIDYGFYRYIRHPIYSAYIPTFAGYVLISANLYIALVLSCMLAYCILRIPREEQMMLDAFGDRYEHYRQRTKRLIPFIY